MLRINNIYFALFLVLFTGTSVAQFNEYEPEYEWRTIKGEHIYVHFHSEAERTAKVVAKIADEVWGPITSLYEYEPDPVHYVIKDIDDYSNGATFFFDNKIEIWASALDFDLRGTHNWLRNVISHEFTHMVQIQSSMKIGRSVPAFYLQFLNYEDRRRPDILYGFPNVIVSYPLATINIPAWFAEGTAQYMRKEFNYDNWDTHRDMILRSYALDGNMLTWNEMGVFSKTSLGNESVYNSGFALTRYIASKYGENKLREISHKLGKLTNFTIDAAFEDVLGKDGNEIYDEWSSFLKKDYSERIKDVKSNLVEGEILTETGFGNFNPVFSPDKSKMIYISNKNADYFGLSGIYVYNFDTKEEEMLVNGVRSTLSFIPGENKIVYAKLSEDNPRWNTIHDLYIYDLDEDEDTRITFGIRADNPDVSPDGKKIVFLFQKDGTSNIGIVDIDGSNFKELTHYQNGEQVYNPKFSNDGSFILFGFSIRHGRDIAKINPDGTGLEFIVNSGADERNPVMDKNGSVYYSSDETGIFNIYKFDLATKKAERITNVTGGAFIPCVNDIGDILYAGYTSSGYKIFYLKAEGRKKVNPAKKYVWLDNPPLDPDKVNGDMDKFDVERLRNFNDDITPDYKVTDYSGFFTRMTFFPFIRYDNYNISNSGLDKIKPGVYVTSSDMLNRYSLFAGGAINKSFERDLFLIFEFRNKIPGIYQLGLKPQLSLELYSISRKTDVDISFDEYDDSYDVNTSVTYNLFEVDFAAKHKVFAEGNNVELRFAFSRYSATIGSFIFPNTSPPQLYPSTSDEYFIGRNLQFTYTHDGLIPHRDADINPYGRRVEFKYNYEFNKYNPDSEYKVEDGVLVPIFKNYNFHRLEFNWKEYFQIFNTHTLTLQFRGATILGPAVPDFFDFYLGGLVGMKSYPFYSISGNELGWVNLTYRFPLFKNIDGRFGQIYLDKIFLSVYGDFGNAWNGEFPRLKEFKKGAGAEIRIKMISFYLFPTSFFFNAAYSFDKFTREVRGEKIKYGKEWRFYGGILFDFSF